MRWQLRYEKTLVKELLRIIACHIEATLFIELTVLVNNFLTFTIT